MANKKSRREYYTWHRLRKFFVAYPTGILAILFSSNPNEMVINRFPYRMPSKVLLLPIFNHSKSRLSERDAEIFKTKIRLLFPDRLQTPIINRFCRSERIDPLIVWLIFQEAELSEQSPSFRKWTKVEKGKLRRLSRVLEWFSKRSSGFGFFFPYEEILPKLIKKVKSHSLKGPSKRGKEPKKFNSYLYYSALVAWLVTERGIGPKDAAGKALQLICIYKKRPSPNSGQIKSFLATLERTAKEFLNGKT